MVLLFIQFYVVKYFVNVALLAMFRQNILYIIKQ
jgi:hypothetical protein